MIRLWIAVLVYFLAGRGMAADTLHLYNWNNYIAPKTIKRFEESCKCKVIQDFYAGMDEMQIKLAARGPVYDVLVPSDYAVPELIRKGLLQQLDRRQMPNFNNLSPEYLGRSFDSTNRYSVPYSYTTTVVGYNEVRLAELGISVDSWAVIFEPAKLEKLRGKVSVLDDAREVFGAALHYLGYSTNTEDERHWKEAQQLILRAKPFWAGFDSYNYANRLANGKIWLALGYSNDFFLADTQGGTVGTRIKASLPKEGASWAMDSMVILKDAPRADLAYKFINFMLDGKNSAELTNLVGAGNPNRAALPYVAPEIQRNVVIFPDKTASGKLEALMPLEPKTRRLMNALWAEVVSR
ncbi:spermidine/putrescine transport system substrate-binding protein [Chitinivorax tropicus]|uniref:Putrescine-binding periplasmic protein n=1 Tax=Chitinivorax tropicus TaxID=714531 RepID=A0A840MVA7_9PROT|nr:spermidine/putrescine ABC transporter substrate-binding protein [Chitinivorax tropicus]MBB5020263.1 spermidine/putrescine transport system substrate-binding protein [Chitinivorax tropicus]